MSRNQEKLHQGKTSAQRKAKFAIWHTIKFIMPLLAIAFLTSCTQAKSTNMVSAYTPTAQAKPTSTETPEPSPTPTATITLTPQPLGDTIEYGPEAEDFPCGINPLTGLPVLDPVQLDEPAMLLSIPHFPLDARPQSGLSFAPWVFEFLISEGKTRLLGVFYGEIPYAEQPITGDCEIRTEPFVQSGEILGNLIWLDQNGDGIQSPGEPGVGGVCINLYNEAGELIQKTTSDSNGYYGFNVEQSQSYQVEFTLPPNLKFSPQNIGDERTDSDADPSSGLSLWITITESYLHLDAGLIPPSNADLILPGGKVGPIRSGRLIHIPLQHMFQYSCLVFAGATDEIFYKLPVCAQVHNTDTLAGSMMDLERFTILSEKNGINRGNGFNYASNLFSETLPQNGLDAKKVEFYFSSVNRTQWVYEPLSENWARYVDNISEEAVFNRDTDKLTGRDLSFENIIIILVEHEVLQARIAEVKLEIGQEGKGYLFRDGQAYEIRWSTKAGEYEHSSGLRRPLSFQDVDGNPIALRPGQSWVVVGTLDTYISEPNLHEWKVRVYAPEGFGEY